MLWFQEYLTTYPGAIVVISARPRISELTSSAASWKSGQSKLNRYRGNYDDFLVQRAAAEEQLLAAYKNQQRDIARLQEFADRFRAKASKASQAQSKLKQIDRIGKRSMAPVNDTEQDRLQFSAAVAQRTESHHARKHPFLLYGENVVYRGMDFLAERDQRIVLGRA